MENMTLQGQTYYYQIKDDKYILFHRYTGEKIGKIQTVLGEYRYFPDESEEIGMSIRTVNDIQKILENLQRLKGC